MSFNDYDKGDIVRLSTIFTVAGVPTDPGTITLKVKKPDASTTTLTGVPPLTKDATGTYHYDLTIDQTGAHTYRWEGTGAATCAGEASFYVRSTAF